MTRGNGGLGPKVIPGINPFRGAQVPGNAMISNGFEGIWPLRGVRFVAPFLGAQDSEAFKKLNDSATMT